MGKGIPTNFDFPTALSPRQITFTVPSAVGSGRASNCSAIAVTFCYCLSDFSIIFLYFIFIFCFLGPGKNAKAFRFYFSFHQCKYWRLSTLFSALKRDYVSNWNWCGVNEFAQVLVRLYPLLCLVKGNLKTEWLLNINWDDGRAIK